jgi:methylenetetrahydrofolate reductase (NADPH)
MSSLERKLAAGRFVVTAEMPTIDGGGHPEIQRQLAPMKAWVDAVNATDNAAAHAHASPLAVAIALKACGIEPVMQLACRDRNRLNLEAEIVGASMHGIENISCMTGDDVTAGDEPETRRVFDLDSPQLISVARSLGSGRYLSGRVLEPAPHLFVGAVENPGAPPYGHRVARAAKKADAGARFLQLQICFERERLEDFMAGAVATGLAARCAMIPSILIVRSALALRFVHEKVAGIEVPAELIARAEAAADQQRECFEIACELADHARSLPGVTGLHFISFRKDAGIAKLCQRLGIKPRAERDQQHGDSPAVAV